MKPGMPVMADGKPGIIICEKLRSGGKVWEVYRPGTIYYDWVAVEDIEWTCDCASEPC